MQYFRSLNDSVVSILSLCGIAALVSCGSMEVKEEATPPTSVVKTTQPSMPSGPLPGSPEAKTTAQKLAQIEALDLLQKGEETEALKVLERSLVLDPNN